jgi:hypothetical protein
MKTLANYGYFLMPQLISLVPSFLIESRATPGTLASKPIFFQVFSSGVFVPVIYLMNTYPCK